MGKARMGKTGTGRARVGQGATVARIIEEAGRLEASGNSAPGRPPKVSGVSAPGSVPEVSRVSAPGRPPGVSEVSALLKPPELFGVSSPKKKTTCLPNVLVK